MALTKDHIISSIHDRFGLSKSNSVTLVKSLFEIIKSTLESGEDIMISGFGKFCVRDKNERRGRNPQTGEHKIIGSRRVVTFKCSGVVRDKINKEK